MVIYWIMTLCLFLSRKLVPGAPSYSDLGSSERPASHKRHAKSQGTFAQAQGVHVQAFQGSTSPNHPWDSQAALDWGAPWRTLRPLRLHCVCVNCQRQGVLS